MRSIRRPMEASVSIAQEKKTSTDTLLGEECLKFVLTPQSWHEGAWTRTGREKQRRSESRE
jgi:hypothetical protein